MKRSTATCLATFALCATPLAGADEIVSLDTRPGATQSFLQIAHLRARYGSKPCVQGHCLATLSAAAIASSLKGAGIAGVVLSSTRTSGAAGSVTDFARGAVDVPVLLVHHRDDSCPDSPYGEVDRLNAYYRESAPRVDVVTVVGGDAKLRRSPLSCQDGFHGFRGKQRETAQAIARWIQGRDFPSVVQD